jgi:membrane protein implicated in regulation of membrane protease activity
MAAKVMEWSRPAIAFFSLVIFALAFWIAWQKLPDSGTLNILVGAIVSLVSSVSGYYFGSSAGSQKKDDVIHNALMTAQGTPPPASVP